MVRGRGSPRAHRRGAGLATALRSASLSAALTPAASVLQCHVMAAPAAQRGEAAGRPRVFARGRRRRARRPLGLSLASILCAAPPLRADARSTTSPSASTRVLVSACLHTWACVPDPLAPRSQKCVCLRCWTDPAPLRFRRARAPPTRRASRSGLRAGKRRETAVARRRRDCATRRGRRRAHARTR